MIHDMYLMEVKKPSESKEPWDYYKIVADDSGRPGLRRRKAESRCTLWK